MDSAGQTYGVLENCLDEHADKRDNRAALSMNAIRRRC